MEKIGVLRKIYLCILMWKCVFHTLKRGKRSVRKGNLNKDILILGNGPSIKEIELNNIPKEMDVCCVNYFPSNNKNFFIVKPKYYCVVNPLIMDVDNPLKREENAALVGALSKVDWELTIITKQGFRFPIENPNIKYEWINYGTFSDGYWNKTFLRLLDNNLVIFGMANVMCVAPYYFVFHRAKKIYISGVDLNMMFNISVDSENHVHWLQEHFYEKVRCDLTKTGEIKPGYLWYWLEKNVNAFIDFYKLKRYADYCGVNIYNLSINSYIDVFEKRRWENR